MVAGLDLPLQYQRSATALLFPLVDNIATDQLPAWR